MEGASERHGGPLRWGVRGIEGVLNRVTASPAEPSERARSLHRTLRCVDLHADPLLWGRDLLERASRGHVDIPRLREGGVALQVFGVVTKAPLGMNFSRTWDRADMVTSLVLAQGRPRATWGSLYARGIDQAGRLRATAERSQGSFRLIESRAGLDGFLADRAERPDLVAGLLAVEGLHALEGRLEHLDGLFAAGCRMMGTAHFFDNEVSGSAHGLRKGGLTGLGRQVVDRMGELGVAIDLAHASARTFDEVLERVSRPLFVSHAGVQATCPGPRNLSDDQLRRVAARGGVVGIGFFPGAVGGRGVDAVVRAVLHALSVVGPDHVGLGSDWDGGTTAPFDAAGLPVLTDALLEAGVDEDVIRAVAGENALRVLRETLPR